MSQCMDPTADLQHDHVAFSPLTVAQDCRDCHACSAPQCLDPLSVAPPHASRDDNAHEPQKKETRDPGPVADEIQDEEGHEHHDENEETAYVGASWPLLGRFPFWDQTHALRTSTVLMTWVSPT